MRRFILKLKLTLQTGIGGNAARAALAKLHRIQVGVPEQEAAPPRPDSGMFTVWYGVTAASVPTSLRCAFGV